MLKKLIKYDFKSTMRYMFPVYLIFVFFTVLAWGTTRWSVFAGVFAFIPVVSKLTYELMLAAVILITYALQAIRYYTSMVTDEGYLTFTLPAPTRNLTLSKLITAVSWNAATMLLVLASLAVVFYSPDNSRVFREALEGFFQSGTAGPGTRLVIAVSSIVAIYMVSSMTINLFMYTAIALGQILMGKNRLAGTFIAGIVVYIVMQILLVALLVPAIYLLGLHTVNQSGNMLSLIGICVLFQLLICGLMYSTINYIFIKKLNLE
ncbi:hypothetical protein NSU18_23720 [Paenibacillus sp. FSL H8-0048]|uniref:hypothetical protein n=1 Tax=Paenibacillus sp. FSL H8-0048 TaxID=2954508 RepID=UPI0030FB2DE9